MPFLKDILDGDVVKKAKQCFGKFRSKFIQETPKIEIIHSQNDSPSPQIRIKNINNHSGEGSTSNEIPGKDIGKGVKVKKQGKPKKCPYCASPARDENNNDNIISNTSGGGRWYCNVCENIF